MAHYWLEILLLNGQIFLITQYLISQQHCVQFLQMYGLLLVFRRILQWFDFFKDFYKCSLDLKKKHFLQMKIVAKATS